MYCSCQAEHLKITFTCIELREINAARLIDYREIDESLREILAMKMARWT
jgi:hypothetical protein